MKQPNKDKEALSLYEKQLELNEKYYNLYWFSLDIVNKILSQSQKVYNNTNDSELKLYSEIIKDAKEDLIKLKNRRPKVIKDY